VVIIIAPQSLIDCNKLPLDKTEAKICRNCEEYARDHQWVAPQIDLAPSLG
jgi:hypothetical protein